MDSQEKCGMRSEEQKLKGDCLKRTSDVAVAVAIAGQRISNGGQSQFGRVNTDTASITVISISGST